LQGGDPAHNAAIVRRIFAGEAGELRAIRDTVVLNAAAALRVAGVHDGWSEAIDAARHAIDSGAAAQRLDSFVDASNTLAP
jgi:anthranilate phosphoribosyltransferase